MALSWIYFIIPANEHMAVLRYELIVFQVKYPKQLTSCRTLDIVPSPVWLPDPYSLFCKPEIFPGLLSKSKSNSNPASLPQMPFVLTKQEIFSPSVEKLFLTITLKYSSGLDTYKHSSHRLIVFISPILHFCKYLLTTCCVCVITDAIGKLKIDLSYPPWNLQFGKTVQIITHISMQNVSLKMYRWRADSKWKGRRKVKTGWNTQEVLWHMQRSLGMNVQT